MAETVAQVISDVQLAFDNANTAILLDCVNRVHRDLCSEFPLFRETVDVTLTAGTREYALDPDIMRVRVATYFTSATAFTVLRPTAVADLDQSKRAWRQILPSQMRWFYLDAGFIGFLPPPDTTTDGVSGYPKVQLETVKVTTLTMSSNLPDAIRSRQVYVQGARRFYAEMDAKDQVEFYDKLYQAEINDLERILGRRNSRYRLKATPSEGYAAYQV